MDAFRLVHDLGHAQVDDDACECERVAPAEAVLALDQREDPPGRDPGCLVEIVVEAEGSFDEWVAGLEADLRQAAAP